MKFLALEEACMLVGYILIKRTHTFPELNQMKNSSFGCRNFIPTVLNGRILYPHAVIVTSVIPAPTSFSERPVKFPNKISCDLK